MTVTEVSRQATSEDKAEEARLRRELAAVYRLIAHFRMTDLIYNHISVRLPGPEHRWAVEGQPGRVRDSQRDPRGARGRAVRAAHPHQGRLRGRGPAARAAAAEPDVARVLRSGRLPR